MQPRGSLGLVLHARLGLGYRVFKNTEFYGGGKTSENSLNEPAELSLRCLAKTENDHVCRCLATLALEMWVSLLKG